MGLPKVAALVCVGFGVVLMVLGGVLPTVMESMLRSSIEAAIVIDTVDEWKDSYTGMETPYDAHAWNCTNLREVLEEGAKPRLEEVVAELLNVEDNWDVEFESGKSKFKYKSWWTYVAKDARAEAMLDLEIVQLNPVYLAAIADFGGSEQNMFYGLSYVVVANVWLVLSGVVDVVRTSAVPTYLSGVAQTLVGTYPAIFPDVDAVARQWGALEGFGFSLANFVPELTHFELVTAVDDAIFPAVAEELWRDGSSYSLTNSDAYGATWLAALNGDDDAVEALEAHFGDAVAAQILTWLGTLVDVDNSYYFDAIVGGIPFAAEDLGDLATWDDLAYLQFAKGGLTQAIYGVDSLLPLDALEGLVVAPEFSAYSGVELTANQSKAFFAVFSDATTSMDFLLGLLAAQSGDFGVFQEAAYAETGFGITNVLTYAAYLFEYLPRDFFLKGFVVGYVRDPATTTADPTGQLPGSLSLRADGTGAFNSGLFCRRSIREVLFGYHDQIFNLVPPSLSVRPLAYNGVFGTLYASQAAQKEVSTPLVYGKLNGAKNLDDISKQYLWRDVGTMDLRSDIPQKDNSVYSCSTYGLQGYDFYPGGYDSCHIFDEPVDVTGGYTTSYPPFGEDEVTKTYDIWVTEAFRKIRIEYDKDVVVRGIRARKYVIEKTQFYTGNCTKEPSTCKESNAAFHMDKTPSWLLPMATAQGGAPACVSLPALGKMEPQWTAMFDMPAYDEGTHGTYLIIEPLTGYVIQGSQKLQYTWSLHSRVQTSALWDRLFDRAVDGQVFWPQIFFHKHDKIDKDQAASFRAAIYGTRTWAIVWAVVLGFLGLCLTLRGIFSLFSNKAGRVAPDGK